jgi:glycosyltransferase involved in cell wall biosynthesis
MNIAIIAPSPVPFVMGGAENLWIGLQRYINEETKHHCELFKLPTREENLLDLVRSYREFSQFDATSFEKVVTGKYPSWMVEHPSHIVYMLHPLRGLYDTYHFCNEPTDFNFTGAFSGLRSSMDRLIVDRGASNQQIVDFLAGLESLISELGLHAQEFRFPGPLSRKILHFLDNFALRQERITKYAAISRTVRDRSGYFPKGIQADIIYPPPRLDGYTCRRDEFLFTVSRLDGPKRIGLLIEAMRFVKADIQLLIGGKGPDESRLKELAVDDSRIVFLGQLTDQELTDYYSNALAIPFLPYDEDYGLITIEAMKSAKPVITTADSGGVLEFVKNQETGLVVPPDPKEIAKAIDFMCSHRDQASSMGRTAQKAVQNINWGTVASRLLDIEMQRKTIEVRGPSLARPFSVARRPRMVVAVTFPIYPPCGGGQSRIFNLYREWSKSFDIIIVSLTSANEPALNVEIAPGLREIRVPKSIEHEQIEQEYSRAVDWVPVTDIVASMAIEKTGQYILELEKACDGAAVVVASHPYFVDILLKYAGEAELWFEAHNVELSLKKDMLPVSDAANELLEMVHNCEELSWKAAKVMFACAAADIEKLGLIYGSSKSIKVILPNAFSTQETSYTDLHTRNLIKNEIGLSDKPMVVFMGSWHGPNIEAVENIIEFAYALPSILFVVIGSAGLKFQDEKIPDNVKLIGVVDTEEKRLILASADLAINPMISGSGSNLKMLEYFAAGVPVVSTPFGARGIDVAADMHYINTEIEDFTTAISEFVINYDRNRVEHMCKAAYEVVQGNYSWRIVAERALDAITELRSNKNDQTATL